MKALVYERSADTGLVLICRLVESDLVTWPRFWADYGLLGSYLSVPELSP